MTAVLHKVIPRQQHRLHRIRMLQLGVACFKDTSCRLLSPTALHDGGLDTGYHAQCSFIIVHIIVVAEVVVLHSSQSAYVSG